MLRSMTLLAVLLPLGLLVAGCGFAAPATASDLGDGGDGTTKSEGGSGGDGAPGSDGGDGADKTAPTVLSTFPLQRIFMPHYYAAFQQNVFTEVFTRGDAGFNIFNFAR